MFITGDKYDGEWLDGLRSGSGVYEFNNGDVFQGTWERGMRNGPGVHKFKNGARFEGRYVDNLKEGKGALYITKEDIVIGEWKANVLVSVDGGE